MVGGWNKLGKIITDAFFPRTCVRCGAEGADVCETCWAQTPAVSVLLACPVCGKPSVIGARCSSCESAIDGLVYSMPYADAVTHGLLRRWKFAFVRSVESYLKELVVRAPLSEIIGTDGWTVVPVPLHGVRLRWRGFDQAAWVAKTVADKLELPAANLLARAKNTKQQARLENRSREDLIGAFKARAPISGRVLLCDDVATSGATLEAAAQACRDAGATSVWAYVIARGGV